MRDNVGIVETSSELMRNLLHEACAPLGKVSVYADLPSARRAFERLPPKVLVLGTAPLSAAALEFLQAMVRQQSVIALAFVERADLQAALHAGATDAYPRNPDGLRQLQYRLRPLLAQSLRPPADERAIITWSSRAPAGSGAAMKNLGSRPAEETLRNSENPPPSAAMPAAAPPSTRCPLIALAGGPHAEGAVAYLLSRLTSTLPGMVLMRCGHDSSTQALVHRLNDESVWRVREAQSGDMIKPGCVLVGPEQGQLRLQLTAAGPAVELSRGTPSVDTFFESISPFAGALGVLLTTPGDTGSLGLRALRSAGGYTIAQIEPNSDQRTARRTAEVDAAVERVPLNELPQTIAAYCAARSRHSALKPPPRQG